MIGIIQKILLELLEEAGGDTLKHAVLDRAGVDRNASFRIDQSYSDAEFMRLLQASAEETGMNEEEISGLYARTFLTKAQELFPRFFQMATSSEDFLMRQATIHAVMASGLRASEDRKQVNDKFTAQRIEPGLVRVDYRSKNQLCALYRALAHEVAGLYDETVDITCEQCVKRGDECCSFLLNWPKPGSQKEGQQEGLKDN